jgi:hypothetical protein
MGDEYVPSFVRVLSTSQSILAGRWVHFLSVLTISILQKRLAFSGDQVPFRGLLVVPDQQTFSDQPIPGLNESLRNLWLFRSILRVLAF